MRKVCEKLHMKIRSGLLLGLCCLSWSLSAQRVRTRDGSRLVRESRLSGRMSLFGDRRGRSDRSRWAVPSRCGSRCYSRSFLFGIQYAGGSGKQSFPDNDCFAGKRCGFARSRGNRLWNCPQERCHRVGYFGETR